MKLIASTGARGIVVAKNMTRLTGLLNTGVSDISTLLDDTSLWDDGDTITIGLEDITLGSGGSKFTSVTRGANGTTEAVHSAGQIVRHSAGYELLSHTFDGATKLAGIRANANVEARFALEVDSVVYPESTTPDSLAVYFPGAPEFPLNGTVIKIYAWLGAVTVAEFSGMMHS
jgi:hypothetical protein